MAQVTYRANLSAKTFPFISEYFGRSTILFGADQNYNRQIASQEDADKDKGIPQVFYCHNVIPTAHGFQAVGYLNKIPAIAGMSTIKRCFSVRDSAGQEAYIAITAAGAIYSFHYGDTEWTYITTTASWGTNLITHAHVNGQSYIYVANVGCYTYTYATKVFASQTLTGLTAANVIGICAAAGYLIAWGATTLAWSSTIDPTDFTPSTTTGAGAGSVENAKGNLTLIVPYSMGIICFTNENAVAAVYSGNSRYPWNFREILNAGGLEDINLVTAEAESSALFGYTSSGMQSISPAVTTQVLPEVSDFLAGGVFEDFNESTRALTTTKLTSVMKKGLITIGDRYLVISYGINSFTHALVYDLAMKRFGKLKVTHVQCFEWKTAAIEATETPRASIGFLAADGSVKQLDMSANNPDASGVLICGKYQYQRSKTTQLQQVDVEGVAEDDDFELYSWTYLDGKTPAFETTGYLAVEAPMLRTYNFHVTGINHSIVCIGAFNFSSIVLKFNTHGRR